MKKFARVLEETYNSKSHQSFIRQLSYYGFKKTKRNGNKHEYFNPKFRRGKKGSIYKITRESEKTPKICKRKKILQSRIEEMSQQIQSKEVLIRSAEELLKQGEDANNKLKESLQQFPIELKKRVDYFCDSYMKLIFNYTTEIHEMLGQFFKSFKCGCRFGQIKKVKEPEALRIAFNNLLSDLRKISKRSFMHGSNAKDDISVFFQTILREKKLSMEQQFIMEKLRRFVHKNVLTTNTMTFNFDYLCIDNNPKETQVNQTLYHSDLSYGDFTLPEFKLPNRLFSDNESLNNINLNSLNEFGN